MAGKTRKVSLLVNKSELKLLQEAFLYGANAENKLKRAVKERDICRVEFSINELDDLAGCIAHCANHENSEYKQRKWDKLYDKVDRLLKPWEIPKEIELPGSLPPKLPRGLRYYVFDVWIKYCEAYDIKEKVLRKIQIAETESLYKFAEVITQAFGFFFDHCFGFYNNFHKYHDSTKAYELFVDIGEEPLTQVTRGVETTKIRQAFKSVGERMLFLFDYGDGWRFVVELRDIKTAEKRGLKPLVVESIGTAPMQYPPCEEESSDEEDE